MKTVSSNPTTIHFTDCLTNKFYGVQAHSWRGFITRTNFHDGYYYVTVMDEGVTEGARRFAGDYNTMYECIKDILNIGFTIYQFDSAKELCEWLAL